MNYVSKRIKIAAIETNKKTRCFVFITYLKYLKSLLFTYMNKFIVNIYNILRFFFGN
jgi:hypothetical protein